MKMYVDAEKVHLFEPGEYGENLSLSAVAAGAL
jgi:hypothetical protein